MVSCDLDGLALEYQGDYGSASGNLNIFDLINNPAASGICRVFGLSFKEKGGDIVALTSPSETVIKKRSKWSPEARAAAAEKQREGVG